MKRLATFITLTFLCSFYAMAQIKLPYIISDGMVLQRDVKLNIWGWASPNEKVTLIFKGKKYVAVTGADKKWIISLPPQKVGGPYGMRLEGKNSIVLKDILFGDVWLCAGQSNMVHQMRIHNITYEKDIANANDDQIRQFWVPTATNLLGPSSDFPRSSWKKATTESIGDFSAVAYFFAKNIYQKHHIPIGIINASVGGTSIEAWTGEGGFKDMKTVEKTIAENKDTLRVNQINHLADVASKPKLVSNDKGLTEIPKWFEVGYQPRGWRGFYLPGFWEDQGIRDLDGVVWFRKEIDVPITMTTAPARLQMGRIIDADKVYINGKLIGETFYQYPQRRYMLPIGALKPGKNLIVIRVENTSGKGGFVPDKPYILEANGENIDLKGEWQYKVGEVFKPFAKAGPSRIQEQAQPTALYNAMIAPALKYAIKGVLWYQGENNIGNAIAYKKLLPNLIENWRSEFGQANLPFYYVQLPNFGDMRYLPTESGWALMREAALQTLKVPHTGMAVTIDLGEWNDIHPDNKKDVGERLALIARRYNYGEGNLVFSGPIYKSSKVEGNKIYLNFDQLGSGLKTIDGEKLSAFEIAGEDKKFEWAEAEIIGNQVVVYAEKIASPKYVRYAWADNPVNPNLYNKENLPASPFRTDQ
ncbi:sialate O-acetylesterase [Pedobacter sp.]|uniref:sialate O-acetylesterase n=1 Tax=Pedobacter sp. TaxID=1411316 RepID=UPI0031D3C3C5